MMLLPPPPQVSFIVRDVSLCFPSECARGATPHLVFPDESVLDNRPQTYEPTSTGLFVRDVTLNPNLYIRVQQFDAAYGGGYTLPAFQVVDQNTGAAIRHPSDGSLLFVRGGDRIGIASMNFDLVYNEHGYVVGLVDDVVCQAVIRNYHSYPPQRDCWEDMVLFSLPYQRVEGVEGVLSYLETDFLFYTWDDRNNFIVRRIVILQMYKRYNDQTFVTFHPVWLGVIGESGHIEYSFTYDADDSHYYWNRYLEARGAVRAGVDCYGYTCPDPTE